MESDDPPGAEIWSFMLRLYARPGVASACLRLQDEAGVDVPLLLAAFFAVSQGHSLGADEAARLDADVAEWRRNVVQPLRALRRGMKADGTVQRLPEGRALREDVKALELRAERIEAAMLAALVELLPRPGVARSAAAGDYRRAAEAVLRHCSGAAPDPGLAASLTLLADAAAAEGGRLSPRHPRAHP